MRRRVCAVIPVIALALPGCIVQDIHDQIAATNGHLEETNRVLGSLEKRLASVDERLDSIDRRLGAIEASLVAVDEHLASVRRTVNNIDAAIPLLDVSGDGPRRAGELEREGGQGRPEDGREQRP